MTLIQIILGKIGKESKTIQHIFIFALTISGLLNFAFFLADCLTEEEAFPFSIYWKAQLGLIICLYQCLISESAFHKILDKFEVILNEKIIPYKNNCVQMYNNQEESK